ncbi:Kinase [Hexamita inflata]|uniref:non-specific serine/threonine protein kinase n=1 Tax=Hexamita inflata TaxID=28002 RepID=A0ABP1JM26_9EUKA
MSDISNNAMPIAIGHELANQFEQMPTIDGKCKQLQIDDDDYSVVTSTPRNDTKLKGMQDSCIFVFEYAESNFEQLIYQKDIKYSTIRQYIFQSLECLNHFHDNRVIYNDLKPDNLLIVKGNIKFSDMDTSTILDENSLQFLNLLQIHSITQLQTATYIITDPLVETEEFISDIVTTPAISAPESLDKQTIFVGQYSDIWQFGQLMCKSIFGKQLNTKIDRYSKDYETVTTLFDENLADLISGCTDFPALRYSAQQIIDHPYFSQTDLVKYKRKICNEKHQQTFKQANKLLRSGSCCVPHGDLVQQRVVSSFINNLTDYISVELSPYLKNSQDDALFTVREQQFEKVSDAVMLLTSFLKKKQTNRSRSVRKYKERKQKLDLQELNQVLSSYFIKRVNDSYLVQQNVINYVNVPLLPKMSLQQLKDGLQAIQLANFLVRYCNFHTSCNIFSSVKDNSMPSTDYTKIMYDIQKRSKQLLENDAPLQPLQVNNNLLKSVNLKQQFKSLSIDSKNSSIFSEQQPVDQPQLKLNDSFSFSDEDLPCKYQSQTKPKVSILLNINGNTSSGEQPSLILPSEKKVQFKLNLDSLVKANSQDLPKPPEVIEGVETMSNYDNEAGAELSLSYSLTSGQAPNKYLDTEPKVVQVAPLIKQFSTSVNLIDSIIQNVTTEFKQTLGFKRNMVGQRTNTVQNCKQLGFRKPITNENTEKEENPSGSKTKLSMASKQIIDSNSQIEEVKADINILQTFTNPKAHKSFGQIEQHQDSNLLNQTSSSYQDSCSSLATYSSVNQEIQQEQEEENEDQKVYNRQSIIYTAIKKDPLILNPQLGVILENGSQEKENVQIQEQKVVEEEKQEPVVQKSITQMNINDFFNVIYCDDAQEFEVGGEYEDIGECSSVGDSS